MRPARKRSLDACTHQFVKGVMTYGQPGTPISVKVVCAVCGKRVPGIKVTVVDERKR